jgi:hypothetical protein
MKQIRSPGKSLQEVKNPCKANSGLKKHRTSTFRNNTNTVKSFQEYPITCKAQTGIKQNVTIKNRNKKNRVNLNQDYKNT